MIYFHDENGIIVNSYSQLSAIEYILEYDCRGENVNMEIDKSKKTFFHIACPDKNYMDAWIKRHEVIAKTINGSSFMRYTTPDPCVAIGGGLYSYFMRSPVKIDWSKDYHFYKDKQYTSGPN